MTSSQAGGTRKLRVLLARFRALSRAKQAGAALATAAALAGVGWAVNALLDSARKSFSDDGPLYVLIERQPGGREESSRLKLGRAETRLSTDPRVFDRGLFDWVAYSYVIDRRPSQVPAPPGGRCRDRKQWAESIGAVDADFTRVHITLEGRTSGAVVIDGIRAEVIVRRPPLRGTWLVCPVGGAQASPRRVAVNLDRSPPTVQFLQSGDEPAATPLLFTLTQGQVETFYVQARTTKCDCSWKVIFELIERGRRRQMVIDDHGRPFRTTATAGSAPYLWEAGRWTRGQA
jgi:hypothetical protein